MKDVVQINDEKCQPNSVSTKVYPNVANLHRGKKGQGASDAASRSLGQVEAYWTVREILPEAS